MVSGVSILQLCFNIKIADKHITLEGAGLEGGHLGCYEREVREKRVGEKEVSDNEVEESERDREDREDREKIKELKGEVKRLYKKIGSRSEKGNVMCTGELSSFS